MMGRYRRVWVVYKKELVDTLRDRRTLLAMVVVPVVLYPVLMLVLVEALRSEKGRRESQRYRVCVPDEAHAKWLRSVLRQEEADRAARASAENRAAEVTGESADGDALRVNVTADQIDIDVVGPARSLWDLVESNRNHLGVIIHPPPGSEVPGKGPPNRLVQLIYRDTEPLSEFAFRHMADVLDNKSQRVIESRLTELGEASFLLSPILVHDISTASPEQQYAKVLAAIVPFLLVIMTVTGAMYPAIDLTAGERERGTLETLAVSPAPVGQIVAGKFGVVVTIAMLSTALNLGSMTAMVHFTKLDQIAALAGPTGQADLLTVEAAIEQMPSGGGDALTQKDYLERRRALRTEAAGKAALFTSAAPIVLLAMVPFAVLFSAVMLATCSFARTFKEAQNYMMPVMMCAVIPSMVVSYMPSIRLEGMLAVMPVANVVLLIRDLFLGNHHAASSMVAVLSNCLYAAAAVAVAARLYGTEAVLFSDVGSYKTLLRRRFIRPRRYPSAATALLTIALVFPAYFYAQQGLVGAAGGENAVLALIASQVLLIAAPAVLVGWYLKLDPVNTFSLRGARPVHWAGAILVAVAAWPVSMMVLWIQNRYFPMSAESAEMFRQMENMFSGIPIPLMLIGFAIVPAICEELLFRGLLTSGLRERLRGAQTVVVVGVLFGVFHVLIEKLAVTTLMGMLLTFVCLRTGSIFTAMFVHMAHNGMPIVVQWVPGLERLYGRLGIGAASGELSGESAAIFGAIMIAGIGLLMRPVKA